MVSYLMITDDADFPITNLDFGVFTGATVEKKIRVWNNKIGLAGINDAYNVSLELVYPPREEENIVVGNNAFLGRCTYSAKQGAPYTEALKPFPLSGTDYDTIPPGKYNEYAIKVDTTLLSQQQRVVIEDKQLVVGIIVRFDDRWT